MTINYNPSIATTGLIFVWDGLNPRCWNGSSLTHYDIITGGEGTKLGAGTITKVSNHIVFAPNPVISTNTAIVSFPSANINVPTGTEGSWSWWYYYTSSQAIDAPNFGKETSSNWDGQNGFVFGNGWGTDGLRMGIGGVAYEVYNSGTTYKLNTWEHYTVTYKKNSAAKVYLNGSLFYTVSNPTQNIGFNSNNLIIGGTNNRGGNWRGSMDVVQMWNRELSAPEIVQNFNALRGRYGV
jgi:hypothetical protein